MSIALTVLLLVELAAGAVLLLRWRAHRERVAAFAAETGAERPELADPATAAITPAIRVDILNAQDLAARESWAARRFGTLMPRRVGREVAHRAAEQLADQLAAQGVRAEVTVLAAEEPPVAEQVEATLAAGTAGVREMHRAISAIPFDAFDGVPATRAVRARTSAPRTASTTPSTR